jgi:transposase
MSRRPKTQLVLSQSERAQLEALTLRRKTAQAVALRARIVLGCAAGAENKAVAARQRVSEQTVCKWRARFVEHRLDGLLDAPRPGAPRTIDDSRVDAVIAKTLESVPAGATHWSTRSMAREAGLSQTAVSRIWRAFGLQPHRQETFKLSSDPLFVEKVRDIVGLYLDPPLKAMVLCVDGAKTLILAGSGDLLNPEYEAQEATQFIADVRYVAINSHRPMGHVSGAGISAPENELQNREIGGFLDVVTSQRRRQ